MESLQNRLYKLDWRNGIRGELKPHFLGLWVRIPYPALTNGGGNMIMIQGRKGRDKYYYDPESLTVTDKVGNVIKLFKPVDDINSHNLAIYLDDMFHKLYNAHAEFQGACNFEREYQIGELGNTVWISP